MPPAPPYESPNAAWLPPAPPYESPNATRLPPAPSFAPDFLASSSESDIHAWASTQKRTPGARSRGPGGSSDEEGSDTSDQPGWLLDEDGENALREIRSYQDLGASTSLLQAESSLQSVLSERSVAHARTSRGGSARRARAMVSHERETHLAFMRSSLLGLKAKAMSMAMRPASASARVGGRPAPKGVGNRKRDGHEAVKHSQSARSLSERIASLRSPQAAHLRMSRGVFGVHDMRAPTPITRRGQRARPPRPFAGVERARASRSEQSAAFGNTGTSRDASMKVLQPPKAVATVLQRAAAVALAMDAESSSDASNALRLEFFDPQGATEPLGLCRGAVGGYARYCPPGAAFLAESLIDCTVASYSEASATFVLRFEGHSGLEPVEAGRLDVVLGTEDVHAFERRRTQAFAYRAEAEVAIRRQRAAESVPLKHVTAPAPEMFARIYAPQVAVRTARPPLPPANADDPPHARNRPLYPQAAQTTTVREELLEECAAAYALAMRWSFLKYHMLAPGGGLLAHARLGQADALAEEFAVRPRPLGSLPPEAIKTDVDGDRKTARYERPLLPAIERARRELPIVDPSARDVLAAAHGRWLDVSTKLHLDRPLAHIDGCATPLLRGALLTGSATHATALPMPVREFVSRHAESARQFARTLIGAYAEPTFDDVSRAELTATETASSRHGNFVATGGLRRAVREQVRSHLRVALASLATDMAAALDDLAALASSECEGGALSPQRLSLRSETLRVRVGPPLLETSLNATGTDVICFLPPLQAVRRALAGMIPELLEGMCECVPSLGEAAEIARTDERLRAAVARAEAAAKAVVPSLEAVAALYARFEPLLSDASTWAATLDGASSLAVAGAISTLREQAAEVEWVTPDVIDFTLCRVHCRALKDRIVRVIEARIDALQRIAAASARSAYKAGLSRAHAVVARSAMPVASLADCDDLQRYLERDAPVELALMDRDIASARAHWAVRRAEPAGSPLVARTLGARRCGVRIQMSTLTRARARVRRATAEFRCRRGRSQRCRPFPPLRCCVGRAHSA